MIGQLFLYEYIDMNKSGTEMILKDLYKTPTEINSDTVLKLILKS